MNVAAVRAEQVPIEPERPLLIVDVDEVLAFFLRGFEGVLNAHGLELRVDRYALFGNIYEPGGRKPVDLERGKALFDLFFETQTDRLEAVPGAAEALRRLSRTAQIVVLTNAPKTAREGRARWLESHGMDYPLIINEGLKGPECARLAARTSGRAVFVDDLLPNLLSVHGAAPRITLFQSVADPRLQPLAPSDPAICQRHDAWAELEPALEKALAA